MKTILTHLQSLPEPYRSQAIENTPSHKYSREVFSVNNAIGIAFNWSESPQGSEYWFNFHQSIITGNSSGITK